MTKTANDLFGLTPAQAAAAQAVDAESAVQRVFDHWVWMMGKSPKRVAMGPQRRRAIQRMLDLYPEDTLMLAIEGCAASPFHRGDNDRGRPFNDIELILRDEPHVERFADEGQRLRDRAEAMAQQEMRRALANAGRAAPSTQPAEQHERAAMAARLRDLAAACAGVANGGRHG